MLLRMDLKIFLNRKEVFIKNLNYLINSINIYGILTTILLIFAKFSQYYEISNRGGSLQLSKYILYPAHILITIILIINIYIICKHNKKDI